MGARAQTSASLAILASGRILSAEKIGPDPWEHAEWVYWKRMIQYNSSYYMLAECYPENRNAAEKPEMFIYDHLHK